MSPSTAALCHTRAESSLHVNMCPFFLFHCVWCVETTTVCSVPLSPPFPTLWIDTLKVSAWGPCVAGGSNSSHFGMFHCTSEWRCCLKEMGEGWRQSWWSVGRGLPWRADFARAAASRCRHGIDPAWLPVPAVGWRLSETCVLSGLWRLFMSAVFCVQ